MVKKDNNFELEEKYIKRSAVNYLEYCDYTVYENCAKEIVAAVDKLLYILTEK